MAGGGAALAGGATAQAGRGPALLEDGLDAGAHLAKGAAGSVVRVDVAEEEVHVLDRHKRGKPVSQSAQVSVSTRVYLPTMEWHITAAQIEI